MFRQGDFHFDLISLYKLDKEDGGLSPILKAIMLTNIFVINCSLRTPINRVSYRYDINNKIVRFIMYYVHTHMSQVITW